MYFKQSETLLWELESKRMCYSGSALLEGGSAMLPGQIVDLVGKETERLPSWHMEQEVYQGILCYNHSYAGVT